MKLNAIQSRRIRHPFTGLIAIALILCAMGRVALGQKDDVTETHEFVLNGEGFSVKFPTAPEKTVSDIGDGVLLTKYEAPNKPWLYMLTYFDLARPAKSKSLYDEARDRLLAKPGRTLINEGDS